LAKNRHYAHLPTSFTLFRCEPNRKKSKFERKGLFSSVILKKSPIMLTEKAVAVLTALVYRPDADWEVNILPFGSIFWNDEMPAIGDLFRPTGRHVSHSCCVSSA